MARISEQEIDRIKQQTDLAALVRSRGIELHKHGGNGHFAGKCPFHDEEEASFIVTPAKGLYHCMGCGAAGNAIQFVERFDGVSFRHAFEVLAEGKAFALRSDQPLKRATVPRLDAPVRAAAGDAELLAQVVDYYHGRLLKTPAALGYLKKRGLNNDAAIERFQLGFADRTLGLRLPDKNRRAGAEIRTRLQKLGLIRESGHEHFTGSLVLPVFDAEGHVAEMYGRKITKGLRQGTPIHLYLPGPHAGIWNVDALAGGELILCEAPLDALTFWVNGFHDVTFIYGTEGFPKYLLDALLTHRVKSVRLAYDADDAGNRAAARDAERLTAHGIDVYRVKFPWGMDANLFARKLTPAAKSLRIAVDSAEWMGGKASAEERAEASPPARAACHAEASRVGGRASSSISLAANSGPELSRRAAESFPPKPGVEEEAAPLSAANQKTPPALTRHGSDWQFQRGDRLYRARGLERNQSLDVMKLSLRLACGDRFHVDSLDLLRDTDRRRFIERAAEETRQERDAVKADLGRLLFALEEQQQKRLSQLAEPEGPQVPEMSDKEREDALAFLKGTNLIDRLQEAFDAYGLVGEEPKRLAAYLACTSRKLNRPLAVIIQSASAAGKTALMEATLAMFPEEERIKYSAMTGQSLFYLGETDLKHKILAIVEEEGAEKACYALKLLQSEGELTIASTGKNPHTGRMETQEYHVKGPVMIFLTTTAIDIDEELLNRCLVLTVDESQAQTERIHALQRKSRTLDGLIARERKQDLMQRLRNAQRLIEPLAVVNDYAEELTFLSGRTRTRRDHEKYLTLIDTIALLHQHQRKKEIRTVSSAGGSAGGGQGREVAFIRTTLDDIALANRLAPEILGRSLDDLPPQTRRLLDIIQGRVQERCETQAIEIGQAHVTRRELCDASGWSYAQVRRHLYRLHELEYVVPRFSRVGGRLAYELVDEPREPQPIGLIDVKQLRKRPHGSMTTTPGLTP